MKMWQMLSEKNHFRLVNLACFLFKRPVDRTFAAAKKFNPMKNLLIYFPVLFLLASCSTVKSVFQPKTATVAVQPKQSEFIEGIEIKPEANPAVTKGSASANNNYISFQTKNVAHYSSSLELYSFTQFKYAIKLDVPVETLQNINLYNTIEEWWGTPYRLGGTTQKGIDCSAFVQTLMLGVFALQLPRTAREQRQVSTEIPMTEMREGDLVFFNTRGGISHVGVYLHNNKFVHASTSGGVMISDLNETYWNHKLVGAGRVVQNVLPHP
jgi:lipoprotein Spr